MEGWGARRVIGIESPDPTLSILGSLGLAIAAGTALVVDLEGTVRTERTFEDLLEAGPALGELSPGRTGVALISGSGADREDSERLIGALARTWPAVVVRCRREAWAGPTVPYRGLLPGSFVLSDPVNAVWQPTTGGSRPPGPGPVLPRLSPRIARALLGGRLPRSNGWLRAWGPIWEMPWA